MRSVDFRAFGHWLILSGLIVISLMIELFGDTGRELLSYQNGFIDNHQYWRAVTSHFTHLGWAHFLLNIAGLISIYGLYAKVFRPIIWAGLFVLCSLWISLGFYIFDPDIVFYVGMSGVLHGLLAAALLCSIFKNRYSFHTGNANKGDFDADFPYEDVGVLVGLCLKILYEHYAGAVPFTGALSGGPVIVNAHLYGTLFGVIVSLGYVVYTVLKQKRGV